MTRAELAAELRRARLAAGLSQGDLAARLGLTPAAIAHFERDRREPGIDTVTAWVAACGRDLRVEVVPRVTPEPAEADVLAALHGINDLLTELNRRLGGRP